MNGSTPGWLLGDAVVPRSVGELTRVLVDGEGPYLATGQKSSLCRGKLPVRPPRPLDLSGMNRIVDHAHEDLTVTVEAGATLEDVETVLAKQNQWLPPASFSGDAGTIGGLIGTDWRAPLAGGCGSVRDYLIGVTFADGRGRLARAGGKVVKNVAGYDLMKMLIGSLGELGVVVEAVFKLMPRPECWGGVVIDHPDQTLRERTLQEAIGWFPAGLWRGDLGEGERLWVVFGGSISRVRSQVHSARTLWGSTSSVLDQEESLDLLVRMTRICRPRDGQGWGGALPSFLVGWTPDPARTWLADLLGGHLWIQSAGTDFWAGVARLREALRTGEGHLNIDVLEDPPGSAIWGRVPENEISLWRGLKGVLDPDRRLVEGRLPGGI